jgi:hypothetical protein
MRIDNNLGSKSFMDVYFFFDKIHGGSDKKAIRVFRRISSILILFRRRSPLRSWQRLPFRLCCLATVNQYLKEFFKR